MNDVRVRATITGRVQGVSYRWATFEEASRLGLAGYVCNLPDGRVELEAEGSNETVDRMLAWANEGPPKASVSDVELKWLEPTGGRGFNIQY